MIPESQSEEEGLRPELPEFKGSVQEVGADSLMLYQTLFETSRDGILIINGEGVLVDANKSFCKLLKASREQLLGTHFEEFVPANCIQGAMTSLKDGQSTPIDIPMRALDGTLVELEWTSSANDLQDLYFCTCRDITERKLSDELMRSAEAQVRQAESRLRLITDSLPVLIAYVDSEGRYQFNNKTYKEWFGRNPKEIQGKTVREVIGEEAYRRVEPYMQAVLRGEPQFFEQLLPYKDAPPRHVKVTYVPDASAGGIRGYFALIEDITRPKAAEDALRAREEEARTLLSSLPDVISRFDRNLRFLYTSPAMQREIGLPCEHFIGKTHADAGLPPELAERLEAKLRDIFETGQTRYVEFDLTTAERGVRNYLGIGVPEFEREGCVQTVLTITRDITERKQAEEKLQASEELFRRIVATAAEGIWIVDAETNTTFVNERMAEMLGYSASELIGRSCFEFIHPDDAARGRDGFERRKLGDITPREYRAYRRDGTLLWMNFTASPMKDDKGKLIGILAMCTDVSERKRTEQSLIENEMRYRLVARATNDAVWDWDLATNTILWNDAIQTLFGYEKETVDSTPSWWVERIHREDRERVTSKIREAINGVRENWSDEYRLQRADGSYATVFDRGYVLRDAGEKPLRMIGSMIDVTERKRAEKELEKSNAALQRMNENLRQFAYAASHDLKEPLRMVSIYSQLLSKRYKGRLDEDADTFLGFTEQGAKRMQVLLDDLLAFSQAGDTRGQPIETVNCDTAVYIALQNLRRTIEENRAVITADPLPTVPAYSSHLVQIFQNLIANALKYRNEETPRIHISAEDRELDWIFHVRDNGIGIEPKYHKLIFGLFKRLHSSSDQPGTGIGLSICARVVERYGGTIWVESEPGQGSTFCFTIPKRSEYESLGFPDTRVP